MSIDVSIATGLAMLIMIMLLITFGSIPRSDLVELANYKNAESALHSLEHDGTIEEIVGHLDNGKEGKARGKAVSRLAQYNMQLHPTLKIITYDDSMTMIHTFKAQKGPSVNEKYVVSIPFQMNGTTSKYGIATLEVGK